MSSEPCLSSLGLHPSLPLCLSLPAYTFLSLPLQLLSTLLSLPLHPLHSPPPPSAAWTSLPQVQTQAAEARRGTFWGTEARRGCKATLQKQGEGTGVGPTVGCPASYLLIGVWACKRQLKTTAEARSRACSQRAFVGGAILSPSAWRTCPRPESYGPQPTLQLPRQQHSYGVSIAGATKPQVTSPSHSPVEPFLCVAVTAQNGSDSERKGPVR